MGLFNELYTLTKERRFAMLVSSDHDTGLLTISIMPRALNETDARYCKDLTLTASPADFDSDFVAAINDYRSTISPLLEQAKHANAAIAEAATTIQTPAKTNGKTAAKRPSSATSNAPAREASGDDKGKDYRAASSGESEEEDLTNDWMKNRQPELF
jgi:PRTRC genetic system protein E